MKKIFLILALLITAQHAINSSTYITNFNCIVNEKKVDCFGGKHVKKALTRNIPSFKKCKKAVKKYVSSRIAWLNKRTDWCHLPTEKELKNAKNKVSPKP